MDPFGWSETVHVPAAERAGGEEQQAAADVRRQGAREVWERRRCLGPAATAYRSGDDAL